MNSYLATILGLNIYVYGVGVFLTLILTLFLIWRNLHHTSFNEEKYLDLLFNTSLGGLILGRILFIIFNYTAFKPSFLKAILLFAYPGVNEFGFWLGFFLLWFVYLQKHKVNKNTVIKMLFLPLLAGRAFLSIFSAIKAMNLLFLGIALTYLCLLAIGFLIIKAVKNAKIKDNHLWIYLFVILAIPNFIIDFFKSERVYLDLLKVISLEQLPYLGVIILGLGWLLINYIRLRKLKKT